MAQSPRPGGGDSFMAYIVGQRSKQGRGTAAIDKAIGVDKLKMPGANTSGSGPSSAAAPQAAPPPAAPEKPIDPPLFMNASNLTRTQSPLRSTEIDRFFRDAGRIPTAAELAVRTFSKQFREDMGRPPTRREIMAQLFRAPALINNETSDYEVAR